MPIVFKEQKGGRTDSDTTAMKLVKYAVVGALTFLCVMTLLSVALFTQCRCSGRRFSPYVCLITNWTPAIREELRPCRENLIYLETIKYEWARENGAQPGDEVTWDNVRTYLERGKPPVCNRGGRYVLGPIGREPDCVGACPLHANPINHALEPAILYAGTDDDMPLASARALFERTRILPPRPGRVGEPSPALPLDEGPK